MCTCRCPVSSGKQPAAPGPGKGPILRLLLVGENISDLSLTQRLIATLFHHLLEIFVPLS